MRNLGTKDEILDTMMDYFAPQDDPRRSSRRTRGAEGRRKVSFRCDDSDGGSLGPLGPGVVLEQVIGAFSKRMIGSAACGAESTAAFKSTNHPNARIAQHEYLYDQIVDDTHSRDDVDERHVLRDEKRYKKKRPARKSSGIMRNRSADDDWDVHMHTRVNDGGESAADTTDSFFVRVQSRESLVSEMTELQTKNGLQKRRSHTSERALAGIPEESSVRDSPPVTKPTPSRQGGVSVPTSRYANPIWSSDARDMPPSACTKPTTSTRGLALPFEVSQPKFPLSKSHREIKNQSRHQHAEQRQGDAGHPPFRVFPHDASAQDNRNFFADQRDILSEQPPDSVKRVLAKKILAHNAQSPTVLGGGGQELTNESAAEAIEIIRKHTTVSFDDSSLAHGATTRRETRHDINHTDAQTISSNSAASAFTPVKYGQAYSVHPRTLELESPSSRRNGQIKNFNDKASQKTCSSDSTQKRRNMPQEKSKLVMSSEKSKCDTTASLSSVASMLERKQLQLDRPKVCIAGSPRIAGLLACSRGNKAERLAAEREEWSHILVYEPTVQSSSDQPLRPTPRYDHGSIRKTGTAVSPLTIITDASPPPVSKAPSHVTPGRINAAPTRMPRESLLRKGNTKTDPTVIQSNPTLSFSSPKENGTEEIIAANAVGGKVPGSAEEPPPSGSFSDDDFLPTGTFSEEDMLLTMPAEDPRIKPTGATTWSNAQNQLVQGAEKVWAPCSVPNTISSESGQITPIASSRRAPISPKEAKMHQRHPAPTRVQRGKDYQRNIPQARSRATSYHHGMSSPTTRGISDTFSEVGTDLSASYTNAEESAFTGFINPPPQRSPRRMGSVYQRKRMASREAFPVFHWQALGIDDVSVGVMSLDY